MADTTFLSLLAPALIAVIAGLVIQSFIIANNVIDWSKGRILTPVDHVVTSLGVSRICLPCGLTLFLYFAGLSLESLYLYVSLIIADAVYSFFIYLDIWFSSLLSFVFYLKIANLHTRLFLYLRRLIVHRTVYFTVASVLLSIFSCLYLLMAITEAIKGGTYNTTTNYGLMDCAHITFIYTFAIAAFIPLLLYCISSVFLFSSLYLHITRMKMNSKITINLETYYQVIIFISFTFIYNTIYFFGYFVTMFYYYLYCIDLVWLYISLGFLPVLHSSYLIYRTAKLRRQMSKVLQSVIDFLFQRKDTGTREDIEVAT